MKTRRSVFKQHIKILDALYQLRNSLIAQSVKNLLQCRRLGSIPGLEISAEERKRETIPVFLPGKSYGQRSLAGYSPWCHESDTI